MNIDDSLNKVFMMDIMELMKTLPDNSIDCIYSDPDYNVGRKYGSKSYTMSFDKYVKWYIELAKESFRILKKDGNMFFINYPKQNSYLRVGYLDKACYEVLDYSWVYNSNVGHSPRRFTTAHRSILHCRKTKNNKFYKDNVALPYKNLKDKRIQKNMANGSKGRMPYSWFYFDMVKNVSKEKTSHTCQIPQNLSQMLIESCTMPKDVVLIHFGGSGSELDVCRNIDRQYISSEIDQKYFNIITDRLESGMILDKHRLKSV
jgi:site-specific DNA-methyltransferase (adenine-specific)